MRELVVVPRKDFADLLMEALHREGIAAEMQPQGHAWKISVPDAELTAAQALFDTFRTDPGRLNQVAWQAGRTTQERPALRPFLTGLSRGPLTMLIVWVCIGIYASRFLMGDKLYLPLLMPDQLGALLAQPWRLFTPVLLHFSILHIAFNLMWWFDLAGQIERRQSQVRLLWLALVIAALSNLAQFLTTGPLFGGLSGVIYGLLGYIWAHNRLRPQTGFQLQNSVVIFMLIWLVLCWTGLLGSVANMAHLVGLLVGGLAGWLMALHDQRRNDMHA